MCSVLVCMRGIKSVITAEFDLCEGFALIEKIQKLRDDLEGRESPSGLENLKRKKMKTSSTEIALYDYL